MATLQLTVPENSQNIESVIKVNAPLDKVFNAHTDIDLFKQWWGRGNEVIVHGFDARDGGMWHIAEKAEDGNDYEFRGSFHEVKESERIIWTFEFLGLPERGHVALERLDFTASEDGGTEIRTLSTYMSTQDREAMIQSGMEDGWRQSIEALGKLVEG